jgi:hypothetical protein
MRAVQGDGGPYPETDSQETKSAAGESLKETLSRRVGSIAS